VVDVGLAAAADRRQAEARKTRIAVPAQVGGRHGVGAEPEEAERAALEAICHLGPAAADADEIVAIARAPEDRFLLGRALARERIAALVVERVELRLADLGERHGG